MKQYSYQIILKNKKIIEINTKDPLALNVIREELTPNFLLDEKFLSITDDLIVNPKDVSAIYLKEIYNYDDNNNQTT